MCSTDDGKLKVCFQQTKVIKSNTFPWNWQQIVSVFRNLNTYWFSVQIVFDLIH